jgi:hypothetical protein
MIHTYIQEKLLLYLDGNLPDKEVQQIREHLSSCSDCAEQNKVLASVWQSESRLEKVTPSPFLWTRLQASIKEYEQTPVFVSDLKIIFQGIALRPIPALAVIAAIVFGIYLGTPREPQRYEHTQSVSQLVGAPDELGLDQFDVIPPGALGSTLVNNSKRQK